MELLLLASTSFFQVVSAQDPVKENTINIQKDVRGFGVRYRGTRDLVADTAMSSRSLMGCRTLDTHSAGMRKYFESWGVDLSSKKDKIYETIEDETFTLWPLVRDPTSSASIADLRDLEHESTVPLEYMQWFLIAKTQFEGPRGILAKDSHLHYGVFR